MGLPVWIKISHHLCIMLVLNFCLFKIVDLRFLGLLLLLKGSSVCWNSRVCLTLNDIKSCMGYRPILLPEIPSCLLVVMARYEKLKLIRSSPKSSNRADCLSAWSSITIIPLLGCLNSDYILNLICEIILSWMCAPHSWSVEHHIY